MSNHEHRHAEICSCFKQVQYHYVAEHVLAHAQAISVTIVSLSAAPISPIIELATTSSSSDLLTLDVLSLSAYRNTTSFALGISP
jgi:hypothetical protein